MSASRARADELTRLQASVRAALTHAALSASTGRAGVRSAEGDERRLRGLPAIGRGVTGAIPGTVPHRDAPSLRGRL